MPFLDNIGVKRPHNDFGQAKEEDLPNIQKFIL